MKTHATRYATAALAALALMVGHVMTAGTASAQSGGSDSSFMSIICGMGVIWNCPQQSLIGDPVEQCTDAWEQSSAYDSCSPGTVTAQGGNCKIETECQWQDEQDGTINYTSNSWEGPRSQMDGLHYCSGDLMLSKLGC